MLKSRSRIARSLFPEILKSRKFFNTPHLTLRVGVSKTRAQFAVSVSKKISKSAVVRNTVRRRVYALIAKRAEKIEAGLYLFVAKTGVQALKNPELEAEVSTLLKPFERG